LRTESLGSYKTINHPRCAKTIDNHAKTVSPKGFLKRHLDSHR
jgi:hypothetical protein